MPAVPNSEDKDEIRYDSNSMDLKVLFGLPAKNLVDVDITALNIAKAELASNLFRLGAEQRRIPLNGIASDLTQVELMAKKKEDSDKQAADKKRIGTEILASSTTGGSKGPASKKRAKVQRVDQIILKHSDKVFHTPRHLQARVKSPVHLLVLG